MNNIGATINTVIIQKKDLPWNDIKHFGTTYYFSIPYIFTGIIGLIKLKTEGHKSLLTFAILIGLWVGFTTNNVNINRINIIYYSVILLMSIGIYYVITQIKFAKWPVVFMYSIALIAFISTYFTTYANEIAEEFYYGFSDALKEVKENNPDKIYITADAQTRGNSQVSEILTLFYDKTDAHYFQGKTDIDNGEKYLPYKERFIYESISPETLVKSENENAAYLITNMDIDYFDQEKYRIIPYGRFCAVTKNN